jgi:hypothetical protein
MGTGHPQNGSLTLRDLENCKVPKPKYEATALHEVHGIKNDTRYVFTICLFISPDLDGHRAPKNRA